MSKFTDDEPVIATAVAGALLSAIGSVLVTHGVITNTQASADTKTFVPIVAAALVMALGFLARQFATPAKKVESLLETSGLLSDADFSRVETIIEEQLSRVGIHIPVTYPSVFASPMTSTIPTTITTTTTNPTTINLAASAGPATDTPPADTPETPAP
jgi:hypothetical protein